MEAVGSAASIIAVIELSAKVASLCLQYSSAVKNARSDVERLLGELEGLKTTLQGAQRLLESPNGKRLQTSQCLRDGLLDCSSQLLQLRSRLEQKLNPGSARKAMSRFGFRALKWPFETKEIDSIINNLERYRDTLSAGLAVDGAAEALEVGQTLVLSKLPTANDAAFDSYADEHYARCHPRTRTDLLESITKWADNPHSEIIFWLNGMAGTGKSTISRTVAQSFADRGLLGASFFFKRGERDRGNAALLFTTIAAQLVTKEPDLAPHVRAAIEDDPSVTSKALREQFEKLILKPLGNLKGGTGGVKEVVVVIDALDECERDNDVRVIIHLLSQAKALSSVSLKAFLTSRPELPIRLGFRNIEGKYQDLVLHEIPKPIIEHDIAAFLDFELARIRNDHNALSPADQQLPLDWPGCQTAQALVEMAVPLFIFAATICRFIRESGCDPRQQLAQVLQYQSKTHQSEIDKLEATYRPVLDRLLVGSEGAKRSAVARFRVVVGSIVLLAEPLSIRSLARLLDIPEGTLFHQLQPLHSVLSVPASTNSPVRTFHLSFRDFLVDRQGKHPFGVDDRQTHEHLAVRCLELLSTSDRLRKDVCGLRLPGTRRSEIDQKIIDTNLPPEVQYACRYWVYHWKESQRRIQEGGIVDLFLTRHLLHWLEALGILGWIAESIEMVGSLLALLDEVASDKISAFLLDTKRVIRSHCSIIDICPLQVYYSAIVFAPEQSVVRRMFRNQFPVCLDLLPKVELDWDACIQTLEGHTNWVSSVAFSQDSKTLASASGDNTIKLWDAATGDCTATLEGYTTSVMSVAFSHDSKTVASASRDDTIKLWDVATGNCTTTLEGHTSWVSLVAFSHNSKTVASASYDKTIKLWDVVISNCIATFEGHTHSVTSVAFSYDSKTIVSASYDKTIKLWDIATSNCIATFEGHTSWVNSVAFSQDSKTVVSASADNTIKFWDVVTGDCTATLKGHTSSVTSVAFSHDSKTIVSASHDDTIKLWDVATGNCIAALKGHTRSVISVAFSHDSKIVASASYDNTIKLWDATISDYTAMLEGHTRSVTSVAFSYDSKIVASTSYNDNTIKLWDAATGNCTATLEGHTSWVSSVAFSYDSKTVLSASYDKTIKLWDTVIGDCIITLEGHTRSVNSATFSYDSKTVASASYDDNTIKLWDTATGNCIATLEGHTHSFNSFAFSHDSKTFMSASYDDDTIKLWDVATDDCIATLEGHTDLVNSVTFSHDSKIVASSSHDKTIKLWDVATGNCIATLESHTYPVTSVAFSHDSKTVASASYDDDTIKLWDAATGDCTATLKSYTHSVNSVAFSHDSKTVASASDDKTIKFWDVATGNCIATLEGHTDSVTSVAFSHDSKRLASASRDETIKFWDAATGDCTATLETDRAVTHLVFHKTGSSLLTDISTFILNNLPLTRTASTATSALEVSNARPSSLPPYINRWGIGLSEDKAWVTWDSYDVLWLPQTYRLEESSIAEGRKVAIGCRSGRVLILAFSLDTTFSCSS